MFSQFRNAIEQLAQPIQDASSPENHSEPTHRSQSLDMQGQRSTSSPLSSTLLAESALSSLRKSFVSQRGNSSGQPSRTVNSLSPGDARLPKSNLEERLRRATFAIGEASGSTTPSRSNRASPSPMSRDPVQSRPLSPSSTPLPGSPMVNAATEDSAQLEQPTEMTLLPADVLNLESEKDDLPEGSTGHQRKAQDVVSSPERVSNNSEVGPTVGVNGGLAAGDENPVGEEVGDPPEITCLLETQDHHEPMCQSESPMEAECVIESIQMVEEEVSGHESDSEANHASPHEPAAETVSTTEHDGAVPIYEQPQTTMQELSPEDSGKLAGPDNDKTLIDLQERLKQVEQRFSDVSISFKRLQAEKLAADAVLRENTSLEGIKDAAAFRDFFSNLKSKNQVFQNETRRLNEKLEVQEDRLEKLQDAHKKEAASRSEEIDKIRTQLDETEALFQAAQKSTSEAEQTTGSHKEEITRLLKEVNTSKGLAKEEEEKRVKAISLLKTVRQKLVKAEKDKDDALKEAAASRDREREDKDKEQAERVTFQQEIDSLKAAHDKSTTALKAQFDREVSIVRERYEKELSALRGQFELDSASSKESYTKDISSKSAQITTLQNSLNTVTRDKNSFFDQLQLRQAELESAQEHLGSLQHQNTELQFQLREANDRLVLLREECAELVREQDSRARDPAASADEIARAVAATEAKYEAKVTEIKRNLNVAEKERYDSEADWSRKLKEKVRELEELKKILGSAAKLKEDDENAVATLKADLAQFQEATETLHKQVEEMPKLHDKIQEFERLAKEQEEEARVKILVLEKQVEESKQRESQMKQSIKTLREELRKVQSSAALLERQRNPGVGYWTNRMSESNVNPETPTSSSPSRVSSPTPSATASNRNEEEVNLEYLRNVILQFLEHKEMRPNLVKVLSIILHFTPQETRRLIAKV